MPDETGCSDNLSETALQTESSPEKSLEVPKSPVEMVESASDSFITSAQGPADLVSPDNSSDEETPTKVSTTKGTSRKTVPAKVATSNKKVSSKGVSSKGNSEKDEKTKASPPNIKNTVIPSKSASSTTAPTKLSKHSGKSTKLPASCKSTKTSPAISPKIFAKKLKMSPKKLRLLEKKKLKKIISGKVKKSKEQAIRKLNVENLDELPDEEPLSFLITGKMSSLLANLTQRTSTVVSCTGQKTSKSAEPEEAHPSGSEAAVVPADSISKKLSDMKESATTAKGSMNSAKTSKSDVSPPETIKADTEGIVKESPSVTTAMESTSTQELQTPSSSPASPTKSLPAKSIPSTSTPASSVPPTCTIPPVPVAMSESSKLQAASLPKAYVRVKKTSQQVLKVTKKKAPETSVAKATPPVLDESSIPLKKRKLMKEPPPQLTEQDPKG